MDLRVAFRSSTHLASSMTFLLSESTSSRAWVLLFFASFFLPRAAGIPHDQNEERTILLAPRATRYSTSEIVHDKYFFPAIVSMGVLLILAGFCCFMLGWCSKRSDGDSHDPATFWRPPLVTNVSQRRSLNNLNSPSRPLSHATSQNSSLLGRRSSKRKPAPETPANVAPNGSSPTGPHQSPTQTPGDSTQMRQFNTNMNGGVPPTQSQGFQPTQQTQPQFQVPMNVTHSRVGGYYNPRTSAFSSATSRTESTQVGSGGTSPGAAGVGSGYGGGGYFGSTHHSQQAYPQNYAPSPHSYSQQQPPSQAYSQRQVPPQSYSQPPSQPLSYASAQSYQYTQPQPQPTQLQPQSTKTQLQLTYNQPQPTQNENENNANKYERFSTATAEAYDGVIADSAREKAPLKADSSPPVAGPSSGTPVQPPPGYVPDGDSKQAQNSDLKEIPRKQGSEKS